MTHATRHTMSPAGRTHDLGEEWACPTCGRRMLLHWPPGFSKVVLEKGDEAVIHVSGSAGLQFGTAETEPAPPAEVLPADRRWLREVGVDWDDVPG